MPASASPDVSRVRQQVHDEEVIGGRAYGQVPAGGKHWGEAEGIVLSKMRQLMFLTTDEAARAIARRDYKLPVMTTAEALKSLVPDLGVTTVLRIAQEMQSKDRWLGAQVTRLFLTQP
jgi:predicted nucleic acid-binding protein